VTLEWLGAQPDVAAAMASASAREPERFETRIALVDDGPIALWFGDAGYEDASADAPGARHRLWMAKAGWRYERSG
jgi:hypothetical protein